MSWKMRQLARVGRKFSVDDLRSVVEQLPMVEGGQIMGYLFRRFGYPERGWDDYKEICCYYLTTPDPRLILEVSLKACREPYLNLRFLADPDICAEMGGDKARTEWWVGARAWFLANRQYPDWIDDFVRHIAAGMTPPPKDLEVLPEDRDIALFSYAPYYGPWANCAQIEATAYAFYVGILKEYEQVCPRPKFPERSKNWKTWPGGDPLKPLARAADAALRELRRPVIVRDGAIDMYGSLDACENSRRSVSWAKSAGCAPFGAFTNADPKLACELAGAVEAFGKNNRRAMQKAIEVLKAAAPKPRKKKGSQSAEA